MPKEQARLTVTHQEAEDRLRKQIEKGKAFGDAVIRSPDELHQTRDDFFTWDEYNTDLLRKLFTTDDEAEQYGQVVPFVGYFEQTFGERVADFLKDVDKQVRRLGSVVSRLELFDEAESQPAISRTTTSSKRVFIVHGHDEALREAAARFVMKLNYEPIILQEQPNMGSTVIEKFEREAQDATFAIVILTSDDLGGARDKESAGLKARARQNVLFELGYFTGVLGRARVAALMETPDIEIPSDLAGLIYIDASPGKVVWQQKLAREMMAAGLDIDLNKLA